MVVDYYIEVLTILKENEKATKEELAFLISKEVRESIEFESENFIRRLNSEKT